MRSKFLPLLLLCICHACYSHAQEQDNNSQTPVLLLNDVISTSFFAPNSNTPTTLDIPVSRANELADGIESDEIIVTIQCTGNFDVSISASSDYFTYTGPATSGHLMPVAAVLSLVITSNNTGGTVNSGFTQYHPITGTTSQQAISEGIRGTRTFGFKYKAVPGFNYAAGTYTTDIVYTITKK